MTFTAADIHDHLALRRWRHLGAIRIAGDNRSTRRRERRPLQRRHRRRGGQAGLGIRVSPGLRGFPVLRRRPGLRVGPCLRRFACLRGRSGLWIRRGFRRRGSLWSIVGRRRRSDLRRRRSTDGGSESRVWRRRSHFWRHCPSRLWRRRLRCPRGLPSVSGFRRRVREPRVSTTGNYKIIKIIKLFKKICHRLI